MYLNKVPDDIWYERYQPADQKRRTAINIPQGWEVQTATNGTLTGIPKHAWGTSEGVIPLIPTRPHQREMEKRRHGKRREGTSVSQCLTRYLWWISCHSFDHDICKIKGHTILATWLSNPASFSAPSFTEGTRCFLADNYGDSGWLSDTSRWSQSLGLSDINNTPDRTANSL